MPSFFDFLLNHLHYPLKAARCSDGHLGTVQLCFEPRLRPAYGRDVPSTGRQERQDHYQSV